MLNVNQLNKLDALIEGWIHELKFERRSLKSELLVTSSVLLPWLRTQVASLNKRGLYVRGDGGPATKRLRWSSFDFYPDLAIMQDSEKYAAFEVKLLVPNGKSDPLTKAIGQTMLYRQLGFASSYGIVLDLRPYRGQKEWLEFSETLIDSQKARVHIFR